MSIEARFERRVRAMVDHAFYDARVARAHTMAKVAARPNGLQSSGYASAIVEEAVKPIAEKLIADLVADYANFLGQHPSSDRPLLKRTALDGLSSFIETARSFVTDNGWPGAGPVAHLYERILAGESGRFGQLLSLQLDAADPPRLNPAKRFKDDHPILWEFGLVAVSGAVVAGVILSLLHIHA